jgi:hypothetical protein
VAEQRFWGLDRPAPTERPSKSPADNGAHTTAESAPNAAVAAVPHRLIRPTSDPAAVVRSLGPPPLAMDSGAVERHLTAVYEEAVRAATALAAATGLLADDTGDTDFPEG